MAASEHRRRPHVKDDQDSVSHDAGMYNRELKKLAVALKMDGDFLSFICRAGGWNVSRDKCRRMLRESAVTRISRDRLLAILDGIIIWQRDFEGNRDEFKLRFALDLDDGKTP